MQIMNSKIGFVLIRLLASAVLVTSIIACGGDGPKPDTSITPSSSVVEMATDRWFLLVNRQSNQVLDILDISTESGALLTQWERTETENQQFRFIDSGNDRYRLLARHSGLVLDLFDLVTDDGADVVQWQDLDGENQRFEVHDLGNGFHQVVNVLSGKALAPEGLSSVAGTRITQYPPSDDLAQQWQLVDFAEYSPTADEDWDTTVPFSMSGQDGIHDPSTILKDGNRYWTFGTGIGAGRPINALYSDDLMTWHQGASPIPANTYPSWVDSKLPVFDGNFWAPDIIQMNGRYYLYYSAFSSDVLHSAVGVMVTDSLNNPNWTDLGMVVSTTDEPRTSEEAINVIDPGLYRDEDGRAWMIYGSHYGGIFIREINPQTGLLMNNMRYNAAGSRGGWNEYEAAQVQYVNGYYYLFVNLGDCCVRLDSDYIVYVARSDSPTGPFITEDGHNLWHGDVISQKQVDSGVTTGSVLRSQPGYVGPGHFGYINNKGQHLASIHYYGGNDGWGHLRILEMTFVNGWPVFNYNFELRR